MDQERFNLAHDLARSGKKDKAKKILLDMLSSDSNNEKILEWIVYCSSDKRERIYYLERILQINSNNENAYKLLSKYGLRDKKENKSDNPILEILKDYPDENINTPPHVPFDTPSYNKQKDLVTPLLHQFPPQQSSVTPALKKHSSPTRIIITVLLCILGIFLLGSFVNSFFTNVLSSRVASSPNYDKVIYEVISEGDYHHSVDVSYNNSSGGFSTSHPWFGSVMETNSYTTGFSAPSGFFAYLTAQNSESSGKLTCNIYLDTHLWKTEYCTGKYCICKVSGYK